MNGHRTAALVVLACACGLSLAACSAGLSSVGATSPSSAQATGATSAPAASASVTPSASAAGPAGSVTIGGTLGSFPIPPGASVVDNVASGGRYAIVLNGVTAQQASGFYTTALPRAGYTITKNEAGTSGSFSGTAIEFTGHGYKGDIGAASGSTSIGGVSIGSSGSDLIGIALTPQG